MMTHAEFSMQCSYMASECSSWAGDLLTLPEEHRAPVRQAAMERFLEGMRARLDRIEQWYGEPPTPNMSETE